MMSSMKRFSGNPLKKPNSIGVKKDEYTAHNNMNFVHALYHLHYLTRIYSAQLVIYNNKELIFNMSTIISYMPR